MAQSPISTTKMLDSLQIKEHTPSIVSKISETLADVIPSDEDLWNAINEVMEEVFPTDEAIDAMDASPQAKRSLDFIIENPVSNLEKA